MDEISEREHILTVRGDVAIVALRAVLKALEPALDTNLRTADQLNAVQAKQPQTDKPTLLSIVAQVATQNTMVLGGVVEAVKQTLDEIDFISGREDVSNDPDTAVDNVVNAIRSSSEIYRSKSDDDIKKIIGL